MFLKNQMLILFRSNFLTTVSRFTMHLPSTVRNLCNSCKISSLKMTEKPFFFQGQRNQVSFALKKWLFHHLWIRYFTGITYILDCRAQMHRKPWNRSQKIIPKKNEILFFSKYATFAIFDHLRAKSAKCDFQQHQTPTKKFDWQWSFVVLNHPCGHCLQKARSRLHHLYLTLRDVRIRPEWHIMWLFCSHYVSHMPYSDISNI